MGWQTHLDALRLDGRAWYYLWRENDELSAGFPLLRAPSGALLHASESDAREVARQLSEQVSPKPMHTADLDAVLAWAAAPSASNLDPGVLVGSWYLLADLGTLAWSGERDYEAPAGVEEVFDKLSWHAMLSSQRYPPTTPVEWTSVELGRLAAILSEGVELLRTRLGRSDTHDLNPAAG